MTLWRIASIACLCLIFVGCSGGDSAFDNVISGTITYQSEPLKGGTVTFYIQAEESAVPMPSTGMIEADGSYRVVCSAPGKARISVETETQQGGPNYVQIPNKYSVSETSGLTYVVKEGSQQHDIDLD